MDKAVQSTMEAIQTRLGNLEGALVLQGNDGNTRSLTQSFIDLETWALPLLNRPPITGETVEMLIDAKIRTAIMGMTSKAITWVRKIRRQTDIGIKSHPRNQEVNGSQRISSLEQENEECIGTNEKSIQRYVRSGRKVN